MIALLGGQAVVNPAACIVAVGPLGVELELVLRHAAPSSYSGATANGFAYGLGMLPGLFTDGSFVKRQFDAAW